MCCVLCVCVFFFFQIRWVLCCVCVLWRNPDMHGLLQAHFGDHPGAQLPVRFVLCFYPDFHGALVSPWLFYFMKCVVVVVCACVSLSHHHPQPTNVGRLPTCGATSRWTPRGWCTSLPTRSSATSSRRARTARRRARYNFICINVYIYVYMCLSEFVCLVADSLAVVFGHRFFARRARTARRRRARWIYLI